MIKIVCLIAVFCAVAVQGEDCVDKQKMMEEMKKSFGECQKEGVDQKDIKQCIMKKQGLMTGDTANYDAIVKKTEESFTSESKKKVVLEGLKDCKEKHSDLKEEFMKCYSDVFRKECFPKQQ